MKATILSAIILYLSAVDAKKHRLCCCSGIDENAPGVWSDKRPTCLQAPSEQIVAASGGKFITNTLVWNFNLDKKVPFKDADSSHYVCYSILFSSPLHLLSICTISSGSKRASVLSSTTYHCRLTFFCSGTQQTPHWTTTGSAVMRPMVFAAPRGSAAHASAQGHRTTGTQEPTSEARM